MSLIVDSPIRDYCRPIWSDLKEKQKKIIEEFDETQAAFEFLSGMFEYEDIPDTVDTNYLEQYFLTDGMASIRKDKSGEFRAMQAGFAGEPDPYGLGKKILSRTQNGEVFEDDKESDVVAYGFNNKTHTPCTDAYRVGAYVAEIDTSLDLLVWWSRLSKLFVADDNKQIAMLQEAFSAVKKGSPLSIKSTNLLSELETGKKGLESYDITDCNYADKLDKLAYIRECRFRWFKERYGMDGRSQGKLAQQSIDEVNGNTGSAMVFPLNMLSERQKFIEMCNQKFGWSASVHFTGAWLGEIERYENNVVEGGIDIDGYDAETKSEGEETDTERDKEDSKEDKETETEDVKKGDTDESEN